MQQSIDASATNLPDERTIREHVEWFRNKFVEYFGQKWKQYNNDMIKIKRMDKICEDLYDTDSEMKQKTNDTVDCGQDTTELQENVEATTETTKEEDGDGEINRSDEDIVSENVKMCEEIREAPNDENEDSESVMREGHEGGLINSFRLRIRSKRVRRLVLSSHNLGEDLLYDIIKETAQELAMAFEYQLSMVCGKLEVDKAARYAVDCILAYLQSRDATFDSQSVVGAVLDTQPTSETLRKTKLKTRIVSRGRLYNTAVYWTVRGLFHKPGLRIPKDAMEADEQRSGFYYVGRFCPWGRECIPEMYGYRGPIFFKHAGSGEWELIFNDQASIRNHRLLVDQGEDILRPANADYDFHMQYKPLFANNRKIFED